MPHTALQQLKLQTVIQSCQEEAKQKREAEVGYCFELFRRALVDKKETAWEAIHQQYLHLLLSWIHSRLNVRSTIPTALVSQSEEANQLAQETFTKFWHTLSKKADVFVDMFPHIGAVLKYLNQCTISVFLDHQRHQQRLARIQNKLTQNTRDEAVSAGLEARILDNIARKTRLEQFQTWLATNVTDDQEQLVLQLSFERGLTPAEIATDYPQQFANARMVRRIKERVLKRARRSLQKDEDLLTISGGKAR